MRQIPIRKDHMFSFARQRLTLAVIVAPVLVGLPAASLAQSFDVRANLFVNATGIEMSGGESLRMSATGSVNLATNNGPYDTDPDGTILAAPPPGSGAYDWFTNVATPVGVPPVVGARKGIILGSGGFGGHMSGPYGALVAGFSANPAPKGLSDFPGGFQLVGSTGTILVPPGGGFLFLAVNDIDNTTNNAGHFTAVISTADLSITPDRGAARVAGYYEGSRVRARRNRGA